MKFLDHDIHPLGMGCWPIAGPMFSGDQSLGYTNANDGEAIRTLHAALDGGIRVFDTAAAYGAGHSERLLGRAFKNSPDALIITKIGIGIDESTKQLNFDLPTADSVQPSIDDCLRRLDRDRIDIVLLHQNEMLIEDAEPIFDELEKAKDVGKIRAYGWSTDYSDRTLSMSGRDNFICVEHAMNIFHDAHRLQNVVNDKGLIALIRSPLAMGVLTGKYGRNSTLPDTDIRASREEWMEYFKDGKANPDYLETLNAVRDLLTSDGRSLVQGALSWLWAKGENNLPIPGARTVEQITEIAGTIQFGPLSRSTMDEIETLVTREPRDAPERPR